MIDFSNSGIQQVCVHHAGNKTAGEPLQLSKSTLNISDNNLASLLTVFFFHPFTEPEFYNFTFSNGDFNLNPLYNFVGRILDNPDDFYEVSVDITRHLYEVSTHPQIKSGDVFVARIEGIILGDRSVDAIGIFKSENKQSFLKLDNASDDFSMSYDDGINIEKLDKGCLILNTGRNEGFRVCMIDKTSKSADAQYWRNDFLCIKPCSDEYHQTHQFMSLCKNYIKDKLPEEFEVSKTDQIDMLNKSVSFFKSNEQFDYTNFTREVIQEPHIIKSFGRYKDDFEQKNALQLGNEFNISDQAVKRQAKIFKSVLKLDKNFHVYIHGDRELIERGFDEEKGMNYYKVYFKEES